MKYIIFILFSLNCFSQENSKPQFLFDENDQSITQDQFNNKLKDKKLEIITYQVDTAYIGRFLRKDDFGVLSPSEKVKIQIELEKLTGKKIDTSKTIIINFYYKDNSEPNGSCIDYYVNDKAYKKFLDKNNTINQFFITQEDYKYKDKQVYQDKNDLIRKTLFKYHFDCGNYIIIKPNGKFYRKLGEYKQNEIPQNLNRIE